MSDDKIFFDVRVNYVTRLLCSTAAEIKDPQNIVRQIFKVFKITSDKGECEFEFRDNLGAVIEADHLSALIMQKKSSGSFFIELKFKEQPLSMRAESIKTYMQDKYPKELIFDEAHLLDGTLSNKKEKILFQGLYAYITDNFSSEPPQNEVIECCKATLQLFPYLKSNPSNYFGIEKLYHPAGKKGVIFHKLRNGKSSTKNSDPRRTTNVLTKEDLKSKLKHCVVKDQKQELKKILFETVALRRQLLQQIGNRVDDNNNKDDFDDFWKFYFVDIDLILYDFELLFENIDGKSLEKKWDVLHSKPLSEFKDKVDLNKVPTSNIQVWQLIVTFLSLKYRGDCWKSLTQLIVFSKDSQIDPMKLLNDNRDPYIIAIISPNQKDIKCYVSVRRYLISVPENFGIIGALDLVYKLHKIFNIRPHTHIKRFINFLDYFIYENDDMDDVCNIDKQMHELGENLRQIEI